MARVSRQSRPNLVGRGFTLVELLIVVVLMSVMAAAGVTVYFDTARDARLQRTIEHLKLVHRTAQTIQARTGNWPLGYGTDVDAFDEYLGESAFSEKPPVGMAWYYSAYTSGGRPNVYLYLVDGFGSSQGDFQQIDAIMDDGVATTGAVRTNATFLGYRIE